MLKKQLWLTSQNISQKDAIENQAATIYIKLIKQMKQAALYGRTECPAPPIDTLDSYVKDAVIRLLARDGLTINRGVISWKPRPQEEQIPLLTARELVQAGYNPGDGDLFNQILQKLREAIARGEVSNDIIQGQIIWVNEHFKK